MRTSLLPVSRSLFVALIILPLATGVASGQAPAEVSGVLFADAASLVWDPTPGADFYNVYRGDLSSNGAARCYAFDLAGTLFDTGAGPPAGSGHFYLVTAQADIGGEGTSGIASSGVPRASLGGCSQVLRNHVLNRLGYGWNEWSRDRVEALGLVGYIDEQLAPESIDETTNSELQDRLLPVSRPRDIIQLIQQRVIRATYARRQLEQQAASFWANHFNTDWSKLAEFWQGAFPQCDEFGQPEQCDPLYPTRAYTEATGGQFNEMSDFRQLAFNGNFRELLQASALSPAMNIYLDSIFSLVGAPNENYPRELMELHTMGVGGGYTQTDVEELARIITGWTLCKKTIPDRDDPLAPCLPDYWDDNVVGEIVVTFYTPYHDCTAKTMFAGTPEEFTIADTCADLESGVQDLFTALDHIAAHPSTARFVSRKILQRFVTDTPDEALVDILVAEWNDVSNPNGVGDLRAILETALKLNVFLDPNQVRTKIKTPLEHFVSALRGTRGMTDGATTVLDYLVTAQHIPHYNPVPTGFPEVGGSWIGTNNYLERQNFGIVLAETDSLFFGSEPLVLLEDNGVSTGAHNAEAIIDFFSDALLGGGLTPTERQAAIDFLNTDDLGNLSAYDAARIRDTVAFLLGYPQFLEQ